MTPAAYLVDGPGFWDAVRTDDEAVLLRDAGKGRTVQALILWADNQRMLRDQRAELLVEMRTQKTALLAEAEIIIAGLQAELAVLRHGARSSR